MKFGPLDVTRIGLGTNRLRDTRDGIAFVRAAVDAGIQMIDTAHLYTGGDSEKAVGAALSPVPPSVLVATKGGYGGPGQGRPEVLRREIEQSLKSLRTVLPPVRARRTRRPGDRHPTRGDHRADRARVAAPPLAGDAADPRDALPRPRAREPGGAGHRAHRRRARRPPVEPLRPTYAAGGLPFAPVQIGERRARDDLAGGAVLALVACVHEEALDPPALCGVVFPDWRGPVRVTTG